MAQVYANNARSTLAGSILIGATTCAVQAPDAAKFPSPAPGDFFLATMVDGSGNREIVKCTNRTGVTLTIVRGEESSTPFAFASGANIDCRLTAGSLDSFRDASQLDTGTLPLARLPVVDVAHGGTGGTDQATAQAGLGLGVGVLMPVGASMDYWGLTEPAGWVFMNGQALLRVGAAAALFAAIGTTYGAGDGSTTFNVPDTCGRVTAGQDDMGGVASKNRLTGLAGGVDGDVLGAAGGAESHQLTTAQLASHTHANGTLSGNTNSAGNHTHTLAGNTVVSSAGGFEGLGSGSNNHDVNPVTTTAGAHTHTVTISGAMAAAGTDTAHNNVQPTIICNKIIKL